MVCLLIRLLIALFSLWNIKICWLVIWYDSVNEITLFYTKLLTLFYLIYYNNLINTTNKFFSVRFYLEMVIILQILLNRNIYKSLWFRFLLVKCGYLNSYILLSIVIYGISLTSIYIRMSYECVIQILFHTIFRYVYIMTLLCEDVCHILKYYHK